MKILNISSIIPLKGLKRENDIVLRIQDYLSKEYGYDFVIAKSLPYAPKFLCLFSKKWKLYNNYHKMGEIKLKGFTSIVYPWIMPPTSNFLINYLLLPINFILFHLLLKRKLAAHTENADLILAQNTIPDAFVAYWLSKVTKIPYIINTRGLKKSNYAIYPISKIIKESKSIITHSPSTHKQLEKISNKINLIPHPIDDSFFYKKNKTLNLQNESIKIISVCRLLDLKHIDWVIKSLSQINNRNKFKFEYNIFGDGPEINKLKKLVQINNLNNRIKFHGHIKHDEIHQHFFDAHIFILPSYPETLGIVFLEAAASQCLVIGHKDTGVDGLFKHKESAIFVDKESLTSELLKIFTNLSQDLFDSYIRNANDIVKNLQWREVAQHYAKLYEEKINL